MPKEEFNDQTEVAVILISKEKILEEFKKEEGDFASLSEKAKISAKLKYDQGIAYIESMTYDDLEEFAETLRKDISKKADDCIWQLAKDSS